MAKVKVRKMGEEDFMKSGVRYWRHCCGPGIGIPLLLVLIGVWLIGRDLGWWTQSVNLWGVILLVVGVYWLLQRILYKL